MQHLWLPGTMVRIYFGRGPLSCSLQQPGAGAPAVIEMPMRSHDTIYILGAGAVGFPLAAYLATAGRRVLTVRTSQHDIPPSTITVTVQSATERLHAKLETVSLARLDQLTGTIVVTTKAYANPALAHALSAKAAPGALIILQNGIGVEQPFLDAGFGAVYRGVLYVTSQATSHNAFSFRPVTTSPIGIVAGDDAGLQACVATLTTAGFPFRAEADIQREIWQKAIINTVFNSICPLLEVDNGVFARDAATANLAKEVVRECLRVTDRLQLGLREPAIMEQMLRISQRSDGQLISTLQDLRAGRATEIDSLNLAICRTAAALEPDLELPRVRLLGELIVAKATQQRRQDR